MKIINYFIALSFLLVIGCSESILDGNQPESNKKVAADGFIKFSQSPGTSVETQYSSTENIKGNKGGKIRINENSNGLKIKATLDIPKNAFSQEDLLITLLVDDQTTSVNFNPSPFTFDKDLTFDLEYDGLDLSGFDPSEVEFAYLAPDGSYVIAEYSKIEVKHDKLKVKNAKIPHFSRYGFIKSPETGE